MGKVGVINTLKSLKEILKGFEEWQHYSRARSFEKFRNDFDVLYILVFTFKTASSFLYFHLPPGD